MILHKFYRTAAVLTAAVLALCALFAFGGCKEVISDEIAMPTAALQTPIDDSVALLSGDRAKELKDNVDRGYRLEVYYTLGTGESWPRGNDDGLAVLDELLRYYEPEDVNAIQVYIYLTEYKDKDLDALALGQMQAYFERIKSLKMTMLLRYAYEPTQNGDDAPSERQMLANIAILKKWAAEHSDLWYDTVTAYQIGMIGAWGEFGSSNVKYDRKKIVNAVCDMVPANTYIQGRYVDVTKTADRRYADRVGYHNDFLVGRPHPWNTAGGDNGSSKYKLFAKTNPYRLNDGETPWAGGSEEPDEYIDGKNFARQLYEHHLSTLSIEHNYREFFRRDNRVDDSYYNIARYRNEYIGEQDAKAMGVPYYPQYFKDADGNPIEHSIYDYIEDFLGYHLVLSDLVETDGASEVSFTLTNFGFGAPLNATGAELVLIDAQGKEETFALSDFDAKSLPTYGQQRFTVSIGHSSAGYTIGVRLRRHGGYTLRTANGVGYRNGVNLMRLAR